MTVSSLSALLELGLAFAAGGGELAQAHRDHDLFEARHGKDVLVAELLLKRRDDLARDSARSSARGRRGLLRSIIVGLRPPASLRGLGSLAGGDFFGGGLAALFVFFVFCHDSHSTRRAASRTRALNRLTSLVAAFLPVRPRSAPVPTAMRCFTPSLFLELHARPFAGRRIERHHVADVDRQHPSECGRPADYAAKAARVSTRG